MAVEKREIEVESLEKTLEENPQSRIFSRVADIHRKNGNIEHAIELCSQGLEVHSEYITGRIILGRCFLEQENYSKATEEFSRVCRIDPKNHVAIKMLADIYARQEQVEKAADLYNILLSIDPENDSVKNLSARYPSSGETDIFKILDIEIENAELTPHSPDHFRSEKDQEKSPVGDLESKIEDVMATGSDAESLDNEDLDFRATPQDTNSTEAESTLSGDDLASNIDSLLETKEKNENTEENSELIANEEDGTNEQLSGDDVASKIDSLLDTGEKNESPEENPELIANEEDGTNEQLSGDDVASKIDSLLDTGEKNENTEEISELIANEEDGTNEQLSGDDVASKIDSLLDTREKNESPEENSELIANEEDGTNEQLSGDDVASKIDSLLDTREKNESPEENSELIANEEDGTNEQLSGDDVASKIDSLLDTREKNESPEENSELIANEEDGTNEQLSGDDVTGEIDKWIDSSQQHSPPENEDDIELLPYDQLEKSTEKDGDDESLRIDDTFNEQPDSSDPIMEETNQIDKDLIDKH
ncbi:hypothetical protein CHISP_2752, partial [Chitinispirillum alkaliphilum]